MLIVIKSKCASVKVVGARLSDHGDRRASRHALLRVKSISRDIHRFDRVRRRHIGDVMGQPMWVCSALPGVSVLEFWNEAGVEPGTRLINC